MASVAKPLRIAMWSGPRNISTAMMRSFGNRTDTIVVDEPFYAHYLDKTGLDHPMRDEILACQSKHSTSVIADLLAPLPSGKTIFYQKHMTHHLLPDIERDWLNDCVNCFLIRDPNEVIASYSVKRGAPTEDDIGIRHQVEIFDYVAAKTGKTPIVIDSADILRKPEIMLGKLCNHMNIPFSKHMLTWHAGRRDEDGIWGQHWYHAVEQSTGFAPYQPKEINLSAELKEMAAKMQPLYDRLHSLRLQ